MIKIKKIWGGSVLIEKNNKFYVFFCWFSSKTRSSSYCKFVFSQKNQHFHVFFHLNVQAKNMFCHIFSVLLCSFSDFQWVIELYFWQKYEKICIFFIHLPYIKTEKPIGNWCQNFFCTPANFFHACYKKTTIIGMVKV